ncbi:hypothetical protein Btru_055803 [Bulinus truncatus]|nr:hypothetical protein Btru_055803 [Bulinus truncatus]
MWSITVFLLLFLNVFFTIHGRQSHQKNNDPGVCDRQVDVAIVGAGPAGSYSAYRLRHEGKNIEVFEYSNRVGGRLYTTTLPDAPDVPIDLGGMAFLPETHSRVLRVIKETGLTYKSAPKGIVEYTKSIPYIKGSHGDMSEIKSLYNLTEEEKHINNTASYLLEKLTGYNGTNVSIDILMQLKMTDGRYLYTVPLEEALSLVASDGLIHLTRDMLQLSSIAANYTSIYFWETLIVEEHRRKTNEIYMSPVNGMSSIPQRLMQVFLNTSSSHKLTLNRKLVSISSRSNTTYKLLFRHTQTSENLETSDLLSTSVVCANKVILALPKFALSKVNWSPLRDPRVDEAINAGCNVHALKVFLSFPYNWWMVNSTYPQSSFHSDLPFNVFIELGQSNVSGHYVIMASFSDEKNADFLHNLNTKGSAIPGSAPGSQKVTSILINNIFDDLSKAFGIERSLIPEPITSLSQYWSSYPFGGGWVVWKAGYRFDDVISTVQRPSLTDDVYYVGADHAIGQNTGWTEGAIESVDRVMDKYFF